MGFGTEGTAVVLLCDRGELFPFLSVLAEGNEEGHRLPTAESP